MALLPAVSAFGAVEAAKSKNRYVPYPQVTNIVGGTSWPKGQALPVFATPAAALDTIALQDLSKDEQLTFAALQGLVNSRQPRIYLMNGGGDAWAATATVNLHLEKRYDRESKWELVAKYAREVTGVVLYDPVKSTHYRNLAGTIAGLQRVLPVTAGVYEEMKKRGISLKVSVDLTELKFTTPVEIYQYMYDHYWPKCEKRLIVSAKPNDIKGGGDYSHTRDMAVAVGAAVVWLDNLIPAEKAVFQKFLGDMKAGEAVALGWYTTERSGITTVSAYGIGTLAADFFLNSTVLSGTDHKIRIPKVPKMPELENKVYVAVFISDGDNIQYTQNAMRKGWDRIADIRGKMALSWTIAPGLVDIAPGIMNYYYSTATANDCFVTGPSGMGYCMPTNTLIEPGAPVGEYLTDPARMDGYARLTETYLQRSGLRVMTIWDDASPMQRKSYEKYDRNLYGATVQNFKDVPSVEGGVENNRVRFDKLVVPYAGSYDHIHGSLTKEIQRWDGKGPLFLSYQANVWGDLRPDRLLELRDKLNEQFPGKVEFVRADHYFNLSNKSAGLPFNLCMSAKTSVRSGDPAASSDSVTDGTPETVWESSEKTKQWLGFDFGDSYKLSRYVIRHAGENGLDRDRNTRDFTVQGSTDGKYWETLDAFKGNKENVTDVEFSPMIARYVKIIVNQTGSDSRARLSDIEIYGSR